MHKDIYQLYGMTMSPYSMKMRSYLRYRHIPFQWISDARADAVARTKVETYMVPVMGFPGGSFMNDSTFLINTLEEKHQGRHVDPEDEADAFLSFLLEDFADEFLVFPFVMRRWRGDAAKLQHSRWILYEALQGATHSDQFQAGSKMWAARQTKLVEDCCGKTEEMWDMIDEGLLAFVDLMEKNVADGRFLFGTRPSRADFGIYGQLSQLIIDSGSSEMMRKRADLTTRWCMVMDDLSGCDGTWKPVARDKDALDACVIPDMLRLSSKYHLPLLAANDAAMTAGERELSFEIGDKTYRRKALRNRGHCLPDLQARFAALSDDAVQALTPLLEETGCLPYLTID